MLKKRTILWVGILLLILVAAAYGWHLYQKPHESAAGENAAVTINADSLYQQYQQDEHGADQKYMGKVIEVSGKLSEIQHSGNAEIWILSTQPGGGGINCQLFPGAVKSGDEPKAGGRGDGQGPVYGISDGREYGGLCEE
ncbi:OB-fold protein [Puia sp. P3]|uniref:OB-fold protein n=1 Tax=Puia sp. P3 TaxID=3423952 RepID=UPI003D66A76E